MLKLLMAAPRAALAWLTGESKWLVLLAVASAGAWLYVQFAHVRADRDRLAQWAEVVCARTGADFAPSAAKLTDTAGKARTVAYSRGQLCARQITQLAAFKADTITGSAKLLADTMAQNGQRQTRDTAAARAAAEAARAAAIRLEIADAEAERRNLVDREWFAAVNGVAGLRAPAR